jgi:hypothetical protein
MNEKEQLQEVYNQLLLAVSELVQEYDPLMIAAIMMTQSLSMYKTALNDVEFDLMVDSILSQKDKVKRFSPPEKLH